MCIASFCSITDSAEYVEQDKVLTGRTDKFESTTHGASSKGKLTLLSGDFFNNKKVIEKISRFRCAGRRHANGQSVKGRNH